MKRLWKIVVQSLDYRGYDHDGNCIYIEETGELELSFAGTRGQARRQAVDFINDIYRLNIGFAHPMSVIATKYEAKEPTETDWWFLCDICGHPSNASICQHNQEDWDAHFEQERSALDALCFTADRDDTDDPRQWTGVR